MPDAESMYLFRHAAYRDVAYGLQLPSDRAGLHLLALRVMESEFAGDTDRLAEELAVHARMARNEGQSVDSDSLANCEAAYLATALNRTFGRAQWEHAVELAQSLIDCPGGSIEQRLEAMRRQADALRNVGRVSEAITACLDWLRTAEHHGDGRAQVGACLALAPLCHRTGNTEDAKGYVKAAKRVAETLADIAPLVQVYNTLAAISNSYEAVGEALERARELAGELPADHPERLIVEGNWANHLGSSGRQAEAIEMLKRLASSYERSGDIQHVAVARANAGYQLRVAKLDEEAERELLSAIEIAKETGVQRTEAFARASLAVIQLKRGALTDGGQNVLAAAEIAREHELLLYHAAYRCTEALWQLLLGHEAEAQEIVESARAEFVAGDGAVFIPECCGLVRLRIAASSACTTNVKGRETSRLKAEPPSARWLGPIHTIIKEMRDALAAQSERSATVLRQSVDDAEVLVKEVETAIQESRPALIYRGHVAAEMSASLRSELLRLMADGERALLANYHPQLLEAMEAT